MCDRAMKHRAVGYSWVHCTKYINLCRSFERATLLLIQLPMSVSIVTMSYSLRGRN